MIAPRFVVSKELLTGERSTLDGSTARHVRVLRLSRNDRIILTDGEGGQVGAVIDSIARGSITIRLDPVVLVNREPVFPIKLCLALHKQDRLEWAVEKATELGVMTIELVYTPRTNSRVSGDKISRLRRVAAAAIEQCQRAVIPTIEGPHPFAQVLESQDPDSVKLFAYERSDLSPPSRLPEHPERVSILIGPPGGFSPEDAHQAASAGWNTIQLGPRILRSETAAILAVAIAQSRWGDLRD